jgi:hypothetical protein
MIENRGSRIEDGERRSAILNPPVLHTGKLAFAACIG